jgi:lipopolysaccharide export system protein LptA
MILRLLIATSTLIAVSLSTSVAATAMTVKVALLPFEVYSDEGTEYLKNTIAKELSLVIESGDKIAMVDQETMQRVLEREAPLNVNEFTLKKIAEKLQTQFVVFGSVTKINTTLSLDVYVFDSRGDPPFSKDFVEGSELNSLIRGMAQKISAKVLLLASKYPEFQPPEVIAQLPRNTIEEEKPVPEETPSPSPPEERGGEVTTGHLLPEDRVREESLKKEVPEGAPEAARGEGEKEVMVSSLPPEEEREARGRLPGEASKKKSPSTPFASDKPVQITSNTLEADNKGNRVTFKGNVVAKQDDMVIFSDLMTVNYEERGGIGTIEASGSVKMKQGERVATGKKIVFNNPEQKIIMTGSPRIWQGDNLISCEKVTVLLKEDKIFFEGEVDSVIYPRKMQEGSKETTERVEPLPSPPPAEAKQAGAKEPVVSPPVEMPPADEGIRRAEEEVIRKLIADWKQYWEQKDLEQYLVCYSKAFTSRGMDWQQWREYKKNLNEKYHRISLTLGDLQITMEDHHASVSFTQRYQSDDYADYGKKLLTLAKEEGVWRIFAEDWEPLQ